MLSKYLDKNKVKVGGTLANPASTLHLSSDNTLTTHTHTNRHTPFIITCRLTLPGDFSLFQVVDYL